MAIAKTKRAGGLVIQKRALEKILKEPDTIGLAFALKAPGQARNVSIKVLRVYEDGNKLVGEERRVNKRRGASSTLQHPTRSVNDFRFKFSQKMKADKFGFGFYLKEQFEALIKGKDDLDEIFIGGGKTRYTDTDIVEQEEWFTFTISLRRSLQCISDKGKNSVNLKNFKIAKLPLAANQSILKIDELKAKEPELFNDERKVNKLLLDATQEYVTGIIFSNGKEDLPVMFKKGQRVKSVVLTEQQTLRRIILEKKDSLVTSPLVEEGNIGWHPNADHTLPCPPHWPEERKNAEQSGHDNSIKDAVLECLGIDC